MNVIRSMIMALSMYTKLPMPKVEWKDENMKYAMCFFPLAGLLVALATYLVGIGCHAMGFQRIFQCIAMTITPILMTGGIHMDGYMDTLDGLGSYGDTEKKLTIMKDPNTGAFAVIGYGVYLLAMVACFYELPQKDYILLFFVFIFSRILSGFSVATFPCSKNSGLLFLFAQSAQKKIVAGILCIQAVLLVVAGIWVGGVLIGVAFLVGVLVFIYYWAMSKKQFGGISGDVAGYFLQLCELLMILGIVIGERIWF